MAFKSQQELYDEYIEELQSEAPDLTDTNEGSIIDALAGTTSHAVQEIQVKVIEEFKKVYFSTAEGDDLDKLAIDRYGSDFARPQATYADGVVRFSRPTVGAGDIVIPAGTVVKTGETSTGESTSFETEIDVTITGLFIDASVTAVEAGTGGNVEANEVTVIESTLDDTTITVNNTLAFTGGEEVMTDTEYREWIRLQVEALNGATLEAIEAKVATVAGVESVKGIETRTLVIEWDAAAGDVVGEPFYITRTIIYVADANGTATQDLLDEVKEAIEELEATGVEIEVVAAEAFALDWSAEYTLEPTGPNYATLQNDSALIIYDMEKYVNELPVGTDFDRSDAEAYILAKWGPSGSNDLTAFSTTVPTGDVSVDANEKVVAGTIEVV